MQGSTVATAAATTLILGVTPVNSWSLTLIDILFALVVDLLATPVIMYFPLADPRATVYLTYSSANLQTIFSFGIQVFALNKALVVRSSTSKINYSPATTVTSLAGVILVF